MRACVSVRACVRACVSCLVSVRITGGRGGGGGPWRGRVTSCCRGRCQAGAGTWPRTTSSPKEQKRVVFSGWVFLLISPAHLHVRTMVRTCRRADEIELTPIWGEIERLTAHTGRRRRAAKRSRLLQGSMVTGLKAVVLGEWAIISDCVRSGCTHPTRLGSQRPHPPMQRAPSVGVVRAVASGNQGRPHSCIAVQLGAPPPLR